MYNPENFTYYNAPARAIAFSPWFSNCKNGGIVLATGAENTLMVRTPTGQRIYVDPDNEAPVSCMAFSNSGLLASAAGAEIKIWRTDSWQEITRIKNDSNVTAIDFCCYHELTRCLQPLLAFGTAAGAVTVVDINSGKTVVKTVHPSEINTVKWSSFPHTGLVAAADGKIVELDFWDTGLLELKKNSERKTVSARKASTLLDVPYQPNSISGGGVPRPSVLRNDQKVGLISKRRRMDYLAIGRSCVSVAKRKIEYTLDEECTLATTQVGQPIESLCWVADSPCNFATGHFRDICLWNIRICHRPEFIDKLIGWLISGRISVEIDPVTTINAHSDAVTALAYPPMRRSWSNAENPWLMASASRDMTVKLWNIASISEKLTDYDFRRSYTYEFGIVQTDAIRVEPEDLLERTFSGLGARRKR